MSGMNVKFKYCLIALALFALCGCGAKENETPPEEDMTINVDFLERHICSRVSPEITVAYAPHGTKFYDVRLVEYNDGNERFMGGGRWNEDGSGLIPEGALTRHYQGPCPKKDQRIQYAYIVTAMEDDNAQPLAVRVHRFTPGEE